MHFPIPNRGAARDPLLLWLRLCFDDDGRGLSLFLFVLFERVLELFYFFAEARELVAVGGLARARAVGSGGSALETPGSARRALASGSWLDSAGQG